MLATASGTIAALTGLPVVVAGRAKRARSILRKLRRVHNHSMDLSRMEDLVGLRVVVPDLAAQEEAVSRLTASLRVKHIRDYRDPRREYRVIHVIVPTEQRLAEIQIRTIPQQLWANESESFGEAVKEGGGEGAIRDYLRELSALCYDLELGQPVCTNKSALLSTRQTITVRLPALTELHRRGTILAGSYSSNAYVVIYDAAINQCTTVLPYLSNERARALRDYAAYSRTLDEDRYEVLILNAADEGLVQVTHGRFFPEGGPPKLLLNPDGKSRGSISEMFDAHPSRELFSET
jgi:hypothetical protein